MTENQVWRTLADVFDQGEQHHGLCAELSVNQYYGMSAAAEKRVVERIATAVKRHPWVKQTAYGWPLTADGAKARARFCRRQMARLARERRAR